MKKLLLAIFIITGFAACNNNPDSSAQNRNIQLLSDSTTHNNSALSDTSTTAKAEITPAKISEKTIEKTKTSVRTSYKTKAITPVVNQTANVPDVTKSPVFVPQKDSTISNTGTVNKSKSDSSSGVAKAATQPVVQKKKGLNKATQGAVIGGVAGAVGGAIVSKNKGVGAVVGGILGAAGGYIIGNKKDKKDNKFEIK